ncbi:hypothetical protein B0H12DRAFT_1301870 [Mycena haematopus]|nr:hypothetical protein B0H12DRAFT_1301870 [Mycena haematopus]
MTDSEYAALYFPLKEEKGVTRFIVDCAPTRFVLTGTKQALRELSVPYDAPLACFKVCSSNPVRTCAKHRSSSWRTSPSIPFPPSGRGFLTLFQISSRLEHRIELESRFYHVWPNGPDITDFTKFDFLVVPEEGRAALAALPVDLRSRHPGAVARKTLIKTVGTLTSPSTCSSDPKQLFEHAGTLAGRPFGRCGPPTSIFDGHLAGLADALRDLLQAVPVPSSSKVAWALRFFTIAIGFQDNEAEMATLVRPLITELFYDGEWQEDYIEGARTMVYGRGWIYDLKLHKGVAGDPGVQCIADYEKLLADETTMYGMIRDRSRLPIILISQAGPQIDIAVAIYAEGVLVDQLLSVNLRDGIDIDEQHYYDNLRTEATTTPVSPIVTSALHLPAPALATPPHSLLSDDLGLKFLYKVSRITGEPLNPDDEIDVRENTRHAVLGGGIGGIPAEEVVVKFTKRYNTTAHTKLAALGLAPKLYYHTAIRGGVFMIVMEKVIGSTAFRWLWLNSATHLPASIYDDVDTAIKELDSVGLVFGDLRLPNIIIRDGNSNGGKATGDTDASLESSAHAASRDEAAEGGSNNAGERDGKPADRLSVRPFLIDFDWAAEDGVGRYPATISTPREFSPAVEPYGLMHPAHDLYSLGLLRQICK